MLLWDPEASSSSSKPQPFNVRAFHLKVEYTRFILWGKKPWCTLFCDHKISSFMTQFLPPWLKMALSTCGFHLQLLHRKQRNVCGQDYRGQVAEGIWHPFKARFWRYVWRLHIFWGLSRPPLLGVFRNARCERSSIPKSFLWNMWGRWFVAKREWVLKWLFTSSANVTYQRL